MLKCFLLVVCLTPPTWALPIFSGTVRDAFQGSVDGANITVWDAGTGINARTSSSMGSFSLIGLAEGDYLFKVEKDGRLPVIGAFHASGRAPHNINVVMLNAGPQSAETAGAGSRLRDSVRPLRSSAKPPEVKPAQLKKQVPPVYPEAERKAGIKGVVRIAMVILPDGTVNDLVVLSAPNTNLGIAALSAVRRWQYSPTYLDDQPVEATLTVNVTFQKR